MNIIWHFLDTAYHYFFSLGLKTFSLSEIKNRDFQFFLDILLFNHKWYNYFLYFRNKLSFLFETGLYNFWPQTKNLILTLAYPKC